MLPAVKVPIALRDTYCRVYAMPLVLCRLGFALPYLSGLFEILSPREPFHRIAYALLSAQPIGAGAHSRYPPCTL